MSNTKFSIVYDDEKLAALEQFSDMKEIENLLIEQLDRQFTKKVPIAVRKYLEGKNRKT